MVTAWATKPLIDATMASLMAETDLGIARSALESHLKLLEGMIEMQPRDSRLQILAAKGFTGYAMMFLEETDPQRAIEFYFRAKEYGSRALARKIPGFHDKDLTYRQFRSLLPELDLTDVEAVYWTAAAWAGWINLQRSVPRALAEFPRVLDLMNWVLETSPGFYYSGPSWFFGTYYASLPPMLGGDVEKSATFFENAVKANGNRFLLGKVLYAENYAFQTLDRALYVRLLEEVIAAEGNEPEELRLVNSFARRKAEMALTLVDEIF